MFSASIRRLFLAALGTAAVIAGTAPLPCPAAEPSVDPRLKALVEKHLHRDPNYLPGDLLTRGHVEPIFNELVDLGIQPTDGNEDLYDGFLADGEFLPQLLRSNARGRAFMREVNKLPDAYDRLERLAWTKVGRSWLQQLVADENGPKLFAQLLTDEGMKAVEEALKDDARGRNFRLPTGRIHTETELLARLQHGLEVQARKAKPSKQP